MQNIIIKIYCLFKVNFNDYYNYIHFSLRLKGYLDDFIEDSR